MDEAWRIVKEKHAATAFTGEGAAKAGGRWNSRGVFLVYASGSKSLATLESLVHLNPPVTFKYVAFSLKFDRAFVEVFPIKNLPAGWRAEPAPAFTQAIGDRWVKSARSPMLALPSVITGETNYLLNPSHPDFKKITIGKPEPFTFDPRLLA
ncbi:MAG: RES family NAD+ phosphorylase [Verrucomicrobia bacterium]|nr:RES family NAD+ phosphorylase [Verrucomicrobiota bacterium]